MADSTTNLVTGQVVKYSRPQNPAEVAARFDVVELRADRVLIRLRCDLPIPPTEVVPIEEIAPAEG